jgi:hypothetical protein
MKPTPIATPVKAFEAIAPATNLKPSTIIGRHQLLSKSGSYNCNECRQ